MSVEGDDEDGTFTRYQNGLYRVISLGGAAVIAILGITLFAIGRTLDPAPPPAFFVVDTAVTVILFVWYILGMRCRLDVGDSWVHIATKYGDLRVDRVDVDAIAMDTSVRGALQWSGRPLVLHYRHDGRPRTRKAFGCLPNGPGDQARVVAELQDLLGRPDDAATGTVTLEERVARIAAGDEPDGQDPDHAALERAVAERLAAMTPEGDVDDDRIGGNDRPGSTDAADLS